jgi:SAM-dependent methyltransferase
MRNVRTLLAWGVALPLAALMAGCSTCLQAPCGAADDVALHYPSDTEFTREDARRMVEVANSRLAPVYAPLAEYLVGRLALADKRGIGIDLGSGPGNLIVELAKRTPLHWVNADINPHFFAGFYQRTAASGVGHQVSAMFADAHALPFRDNYADVLVSRGTFPFWQDQERAFREIHRVLKPGGVAFVGRGFSPNLPPAIARKVRAGGRGGPPYKPDETEAALRRIMKGLNIRDYQILRPQPSDGSDINYGVWIEWRK